MKNLIVNSAFAELTSVPSHPGLRRGRIIYCDDQPNSNGFGVKHEDFPDLMNTLVGTPVKIKFVGSGPDGHKGSIPIGHITAAMEAESDGVHQILIDTIMYADDYPDEIEWLETKVAEAQKDPSKKAPGVSFEITYKESILEDGINWIKGLVARAATFVKSPAYGDRTALLALAADKTLTADDFMTELSALVTKDSPKIPVKGGSNMTEEEIKALKDELAKIKADLEAANTLLAERDVTIGTLTTEKQSLEDTLKENTTVLAEYKNKELLDTRKAVLAEAGITFEVKAERITNMSEEDFAEYVDDLKAAVAEASKKETIKDPKVALASHRERLPKFDPSGNDKLPTASELAGRLKNISRSTSEEDTE